MNRPQDERIAETVRRERTRLLGFIRSRVPDPSDAEDILQDVFFELAEANRLLVPIEHVTGWLFRVARNRITDRFRRHAEIPFGDLPPAGGGEDPAPWEEWLPARDAGPEAMVVREALLDALDEAIAALPEDQRRVFVGHELEGKSFKEMAAETGENLNTLLSRKRYAVLALRERLRDVYDEMTEE